MDTARAGRPPRGLELLPVGRHAAEQEVRRRLQGVREEEQPARRRQARDRRPDGGRLLRRLRLEAGRREGQVLRGGRGPQGRLRPGVPRAGRQDQDGRGQPPHLQAGAHRRDPQGRPVQGRLALEGPREGRSRGASTRAPTRAATGSSRRARTRRRPDARILHSLDMLLARRGSPLRRRATPPAPPADVERALADLAGGRRRRGGRRRSPSLGNTGDPKWLAFLGALRDGSVYVARRSGRAERRSSSAAPSRPQGDKDVVEIKRAYDGASLGDGAGGRASTEVAADRRLRLAIKPFLDADETRGSSPIADPGVRRAAAAKLGNQADVAAAPALVEAALAKEADRVGAPRAGGGPGADPARRTATRRRARAAARRARRAALARTRVPALRAPARRTRAASARRAGGGGRRDQADRALERC